MRIIRAKIDPAEALCVLNERGAKRVAPIQESPYYRAMKQNSLLPLVEYHDHSLERSFSAMMVLWANVGWTLSLAEIIRTQGFAPQQYGTWPRLRGREIIDGHRRVAFAAALEIERIEVENTIQELYPWWSQAFQVGDGWIDVAHPPDYVLQTSGRMQGYEVWDRIAIRVPFAQKSVLDLGCGPGFYCHRAADVGARSVTGIDRNLSVAQHTNAELQQDVVAQATDTAWVCGYRNIQFISADLHNFKTDRRWDIVLALRVHYHMGNPKKFLAMASSLAQEVLVIQCNPTHNIEAGTLAYTLKALTRWWSEIDVVEYGNLPILICRGKNG